VTDQDATRLGRIAAAHLPPILYALEVCALQMDGAGRAEDAEFYRRVARALAEAAGTG
jgi:hypothetical protein